MLARVARAMLPRLVRRFLYPLLERDFTYDAYARLLDRLSDTEHFEVVPLREFAAAQPQSRVLVALRHDVDRRLESAVEMARMEHDHGLRATYFVLHTAAYWRNPDLVPTLLELQNDLGHEIGWHNDLVTLECVHRGNAREFLARELERLRAAGLTVDGTASHGLPMGYRLGYHNNYFFEDFDGEELPHYPNTTVVPTAHGPCKIPKARLADFGLRYEAYHLGNDAYFSDASFDERGRRWHPDALDLEELASGRRVIILVHPCHWDPSGTSKLRRLPGEIVRAVRGEDPPAGAGT